ncbi:hypothetical protein F750_2463 [Streptomyces sp. PAMC 26508]|nr:hypothetical protein F750_2463 [Streptomyces sp. PAMC 26508]
MRGGRVVHELRITLGSFMGNLQSHGTAPLPERRAAYTSASVTSITPRDCCATLFVRTRLSPQPPLCGRLMVMERWHVG